MRRLAFEKSLRAMDPRISCSSFSARGNRLSAFDDFSLDHVFNRVA